MCKNGIAYFVGHELSSTGNINFIDKIIVPDIPIRKDIYLCGKHFFPEEIIKLHNDFEDFGLVHIAGEETSYFIINGENIHRINKLSICRQKNHRMGGQSSGRFMRIRQNQIQEYITTIVQDINKFYKTKEGQCSVKEIIICGSTDIKNDIPQHEILEVNIKNKIRKNIYNCENICNENLLKIIQDSNQRNDRNLKIVYQEMFDKINKGDIDNILYGKKEILIEKINNRLIKTIIITEKTITDIGKPLITEISSNGGSCFIINNFDEEMFPFITSIGGFIASTYN